MSDDDHLHSAGARADAPGDKPQALASEPSPAEPFLHRFWRQRAEVAAIRTAALIATIAAWELVRLTSLGALIPGFFEVVGHVGVLMREDRFLSDVGHTLYRLFAGFFIALIGGAIVGMLMGTRRSVAAYFRPIVLLGLIVPGISWALITILVFGLGDVAAISAIAIITAPGVVLNAEAGARTVDADLMQMTRVFGAPRWQTLRHVVFPHVAPALLAAARYGFALAWQITAVVEIFGLGSGMGFRIVQAYSTGRFRGTTAMVEILGWTLLMIVLMLIVEYGGFQTLERRAQRWRPRSG